MAGAGQLAGVLEASGADLTPDRYGGITIDLSAGNEGAARGLADAMEAWRTEGTYRGVWLRLVPGATPHSGAILQAAVASGFELHTVDQAGGGPKAIVLKAWLPASKSGLPDAPHHQFGVGGMVLNGKGEVLAIQEKRGVTAGLADFWKLPGGLVDPGEDIAQAVAREIKEETGVAAVFHSIGAFRESHQGPFGSTDLYAVCAMTLDGDAKAVYGASPPVPVPQEEEIAKCAWVPLSTFLGSKYYRRGLYGSMLRTAAQAAQAAEAHANPYNTTGEASGVGLREVKMKSAPKTVESMFYAGKAKL